MTTTTTGPTTGRRFEETELRAIAALFPETVHIVVLEDSPLKTIKDLKWKRVSIDAAGSGTNAMARTVLGAFKMGEKTVVFSFENAERSLEMLQAGELDAFFFVGGAPLGVVEELAAAGKISCALRVVDGA